MNASINCLYGILSTLPPKPHAPQKEYQEYVRKGVCNVLLAYTIETGQRHLQVTTTRTKADYALLTEMLQVAIAG
jgi:hypothetical protein